MAWRTFLGPLLIGTQKWGAVRNTGAVNLAQSADILFSTGAGNIMVLPAGAQILSLQIITTTVFAGGTSPTITVNVAGTAVTTALTAPAALGVTVFAAAATAGSVALWKNVGVADAAVTVTIAGVPTSGAGTVQIEYVMREVDGSQFPAQG